MKPRIKISHLLLRPSSQADISNEIWNSVMAKQHESISAFRSIASEFSAYTQYYNEVNRTELPVLTCAAPEILSASKDLGSVGSSLSYGHYGAYLAHRSAIEDFGDFDALLVVESDVTFFINPSEMVDVIYGAYTYALQHRFSLVTFGEVVYGSGSLASQSDTEIDLGAYKQIDHFLNTHCYLIMRSEREAICRKLRTSGWHSPDIWLYWNYDRRSPILSLKAPVAFEISGYSVADYVNKPAGGPARV